MICLILGSQTKNWWKRDKWAWIFVITFLILCFFNAPELLSPPDHLWSFKFEKEIVTGLHEIFTIGVLVLAFAGGIHVIERKKRQQEKQLILECREALRYAKDVLNTYKKHFGPPKDWEKTTGRYWEEAFKEFKELVNSLDTKIDPWT